MKYVNVVFISTLLLFSGVSDSQILGIDLDPRHIDPWGIRETAKKLQQALVTIRELRDANSKIQAELNEANRVLAKITPILKDAEHTITIQSEVIAAKNFKQAILTAENGTLKSKISDLEMASNRRVSKFLSMYGLDENSHQGQSVGSWFLGKKIYE